MGEIGKYWWRGPQGLLRVSGKAPERKASGLLTTPCFIFFPQILGPVKLGSLNPVNH